MNPSSFQQSKTPAHDEMHKCLTDTDVLQLLGRKAFRSVNQDSDDPVKIDVVRTKIEEPLYSREYLIGVADIIIDYRIYRQDDTFLDFKVLVELKPQLVSISGAISQLKIYSKFVRSDCMVIITMDKEDQSTRNLVTHSGITLLCLNEILPLSYIWREHK